MSDVRLLSEKPPFKRVLLVGENPIRSAPTLRLANELNRVGIETEFSNKTESNNTFKWLQLALQSQVIIFVQYGDCGYFLRQIRRARLLWRARLLGCTVIRWWVGTDVLNCLESETYQRNAIALSKECALNIAVSPHLVTELREIGIEADYLPSPFNLTMPGYTPPVRLPKAVLAYLPTKRRSFYGEEVLIAAIEANPDLEFFIVSDDSHSLQHYSNVTSLGWVENMEEIWPKIGLLLRITRHDGMPRMVLEALARSRYIVYSQPFEACWFATSTEQVLSHLAMFKTLDGTNTEGPEVVRKTAFNVGAKYVAKIAAHREASSPVRRLSRLVQSIGKVT